MSRDSVFSWWYVAIRGNCWNLSYLQIKCFLASLSWFLLCICWTGIGNTGLCLVVKLNVIFHETLPRLLVLKKDASGKCWVLRGFCCDNIKTVEGNIKLVYWRHCWALIADNFVRLWVSSVQNTQAKCSGILHIFFLRLYIFCVSSSYYFEFQWKYCTESSGLPSVLTGWMMTAKRSRGFVFLFCFLE